RPYEHCDDFFLEFQENRPSFSSQRGTPFEQNARVIWMRIHGVGKSTQMLKDHFRSRAAFPMRRLRHLDKKPRYLFEDGINQRFSSWKIEKACRDGDLGLSRDFCMPRAADTPPCKHP